MIYLRLFWSYVKIGFTSFGGMSMIPLISDEMTSHGWMSLEEVSDIVAIAEITPGPLGLNAATFSGMRAAGLLGSIVANLGVMLPSFTLALLAAMFFERFSKADVTERIMCGVRPAGLGLVIGIMVSIGITTFFPQGSVDWYSLLIAGIDLILFFRFKLSIPQVIGISAVLGLLFYGLVA